MLMIKNISNESDFETMCNIESTVAKHSDFSIYSSRPCNLVFDRYLFGSGAQDVFKYGKLIIKDGTAIGYVLAYLVFSYESEFVVRLLPQYSNYYTEAIESVEAMFSDKKALSIIANDSNIHLCNALSECGFVRENEERWQAGLDLRSYTAADVVWQGEFIKILSENDIEDRVKFAEIPTGEVITKNMYEELMSCDYYNTALDYVVRSAAADEFIGFVTWWTDKNSKTATLEPVACLPNFRRKGIMKRTLFHGLNELKRQGLHYAYVSTSIDNEKAQALYLSVGFQKSGTVCRWVACNEKTWYNANGR